MRRFKKKNSFKLKNVLIIIIISIVFITSLFINTIGKRANENIFNISRNLINTINTNTVNSNIKMDLLKKYNINDLIIINYSDGKVVNVDYNLETAYEILIEIKKTIIESISNNTDKYYNYQYEVYNNNVIIEIPFYSYTNNVLIANLGPKIRVGLSMIRLIDGSVSTKIKTYGVNSLLVELYINFSVTSTIVIPNEKTNDTTNTFNVLISSKVIQGEIPSYYNGLFESKSNVISD